LPFTYGGFAGSALLALSLSVDIFVAFVSYGGCGIRVSRRAALVSASVCAGIFFAAGRLGALLGPLAPGGAAKAAGFLSLLAVGLLRIFDGEIKTALRHLRRRPPKLLEVCADPGRADLDSGGELSPRESALLAAAMSFDGAAAGFGVGAGGDGAALTAALSFVFCLAAVALGLRLGKALCGTRFLRGRSMTAAGGLALLALAFRRLA
jgi:putative sporulation protein YtaF